MSETNDVIKEILEDFFNYLLQNDENTEEKKRRRIYLMA